MDIVKYIENRENGRNVFIKTRNDMMIENFGCIFKPEVVNDNYKVSTCKYSRNNNYLHVVGCSMEDGYLTIGNDMDRDLPSFNLTIKKRLDEYPIFDFAWAEPDMKLAVACTSPRLGVKLCDVSSNDIIVTREFPFFPLIWSIKFCPGSSDIFCTANSNNSISICDARDGRNSINEYYCISNVHGRQSPMSIIYKDSLNILSCSARDDIIKMWDLRMVYTNSRGNMEPMPSSTFQHAELNPAIVRGYTYLTMDPQSNYLYANRINSVIDCFLLDSSVTNAVCQYSGYEQTSENISLSNDGLYLFSGCQYQNGVFWRTGFPYNENPMYTIENSYPGVDTVIRDFIESDWCADPATPFRLVTSCVSKLNIWSLLTGEQRELRGMKVSKSSAYTKIPVNKNYTAPIKLDDKLKKIYQKQTEQNMKNWDV